MKFVIAGGSGALGRAVADHRTRLGDDVVVLTRRSTGASGAREVLWDGESPGPWQQELDGAVLLNLAGEIVDQRPTRRTINRLAESRVRPTRALVEAARQAPPIRWLQMSTTAIYGDGGDTVIREGYPVREGPAQMTGVATAWERAAHPAAALTSQVILHTGIVLQANTPALDRLLSMTRWGLGGRVGPGTQWITWLHIADFLGIVDALVSGDGAMEGDGATHGLGTIDGVVHVCTPGPVRNAELMAQLRHALGRGWAPPTPAPLVRLGAPLLGTDAKLALLGRRCLPQRLTDGGYEFRYPELGAAISDLISEAQLSKAQAAKA
ncbi:epimerase [Leifsonia sp. Root112D2]|uniref:epimerase n=1 Tax=Leifsonia sp. Root112D2 TaxID=1736426 RepID=UPI0006FE2E0B|nr:DUF1731 domain-containing protein [Leifsonia sp. Root112D2]KQV07432.1 hypothetical protein ASC63_09105 [Leifsonia sp. Root112D2]